MALTDSLIGDKPIKVQVELDDRTTIILTIVVVVVILSAVFIFRSATRALTIQN